MKNMNCKAGFFVSRLLFFMAAAVVSLTCTFGTIRSKAKMQTGLLSSFFKKFTIGKPAMKFWLCFSTIYIRDIL
ncbi:hypothetical protein BH10BAC2_BH10BAC2_07740 [soil metagenome]